MERKIVSILFADLVGFTSLSEQLDPEDVAAVQSAYFEVVRDTIDRYGGRLEKFIGDAVMAVFGIPRTLDDDADRAVRAGLALSSAVEQLGSRIGLETGSLGVRVGVNTGEVVHSPEARAVEAIVTGDPVNVAARLQAAAEPGRVLIGEMTALAVAGAVELEPAGELELKGKSQPVPAHHALAAREERSRELAMGELRAGLLGREAEVAYLSGLLVADLPRRVLVVAPPGVGKTRLVDELAAGIDTVSLRARLRPDVLAPFEPVGQLLRAAVGRGDRGLEEGLVHAGISPGRARVLVEECAPLLAPDSGDGPAGDRDARLAAWLETLDALTACPSLLIVEDIHWAGADLLAFLELAGAAEGRRLVIATSRPSVLETAAGWCEGGEVLHLPTLPRATTAQLVHALVGDALPEALVERIAERADGNPLFVEELLRTWVSVGVLSRQDGTWTLRRSDQDVPLPGTVQSIYAAQLDDLPPSGREVARKAAVAGRRFPRASLVPLGAPEDGVQILARRALVAGPEPDPTIGESYSYRHALLRDAGYASLARAERAVLHARLAGWLEETAPAEQVAEPIARHYARALESAPALAAEVAPGLSREDCRQLGADWFERAADGALALSAHESARELFRRSLELTDTERALDRMRRLRRLGEVTGWTADMDEGAGLLEEALALARAEGEREELALAAASLSKLLDQQIKFMPAMRVADDALREIGERDDAATALLLLRRAIALSNGRDEEDEPLADARRALELARAVGDRPLELEARSFLGSLGGQDATAWEELVALAGELGAWEYASDALHEYALENVAARPGAARVIAERAVELCQERGLREQLVWSLYLHVEIGLRSGDWDHAAAAARRALDIGIPNGYDRPVVRTWIAVQPIATARQDMALLAELHEWLTWRFREPENPSPYAQVVQASLHLGLATFGFGEPFVPDPSLGEHFVVRTATPSWVAALETVTDGWLRAGELEAAAAALERMRVTACDPEGPRFGAGVYRLLLARLLAARGEDPSAELGPAVADLRAAEAPWWLAKALRDGGAIEDAVELERALGIPA